MVKKPFLLSLVLFLSLGAVVSCVDIDRKGKEALDYFLEAVANGRVEDVEIWTQCEPCMTTEDLSEEEKTKLLALIKNTQYRRALRKNQESPGTPDGHIVITLDYGSEHIGFYGDFGAVGIWMFSHQYDWYIDIENESLCQWLKNRFFSR